MDCVFCSIIKGEIPSFKVYEDENVYAFLDINPVSKGHTLVTSKKHVQRMEQVEADYFAGVQKVAKSIAKTYGDYNTLVNNGELAGQEVKHLHTHLIPRTGQEKFKIDFVHEAYLEGEADEARLKIIDNFKN